MKKLSIVLTLAMCMAFVSCGSTEKFVWSEFELSNLLPEPPSNKAEIHMNNNKELWLDTIKITEPEYNNYIDACKEFGFVIEEELTGYMFTAYNSEGYKIDLRYFNEELGINLDAPMEMSEIIWPTSDVAKLIPVPKSNTGNISYEKSDKFFIYVGNTSISDYNEYVQACLEMGFDVDYDKGDKHYYAYNEQGYDLDVCYEGNNVMSVEIDSPDESVATETTVITEATTDAEITSETTTTTTEAKTSTTTSATVTETEATTTTVATKAETTAATTETPKVASGISPEFKEAMDSYEAFFDEYIAFMNEYAESDDVLGMMTDYLDFMTRYTDTMAKLDALESSDMTDEELIYYTETMTRINKKLLEVA